MSNKLEIQPLGSKETLHNATLKLSRIFKRLYGILFLIALAFEILFSLSTWKYTVSYDYFCGNPLMGNWAQWFVYSLFVGAVILPGALWAIWHRNNKVSLLFITGSVLFIIDIVFMLILGLEYGTIPDFINFIGYAFY
jgi:hypothetical protein